jgi:hypothetical protein
MTEKVVFEFWYHFSSLKNHPNGPPVRDAGKALDLPARSRFGEGWAETF